MTSRYKFRVSDDLQDEEWDAFLAKTPGGHHVQTTLWAQVKATLGVRAVRVLATDHGELVAGGQMLIRSLPVLGAVGYVSRGPVVATRDPRLRVTLLAHLRTAAREKGVRHLTVQPPTTDPEMVTTLEEEGFLPTSQTVAPAASVVVDLSPPREEIMARMHKKTRYNIRLAGRRGVTVRSGGESDLDTYCRMVEATAQRQGFQPYPSEYYATMWQVLAPRGYLRFSVAEHQGEVIAAQFAVPFGNTVINKLGVWSGHSGEYHPNEALHWETMQWSRDHGYSFYDLEGIDLQAAEALSDGRSLSPALQRSVTKFKLGFGGDIRLFPGAYFTASSPIVRWLYGAVLPRVSNWKTVRRGVAMLRTGASPGSDGANGGNTG